jgi:hypothetical protein
MSSSKIIFLLSFLFLTVTGYSQETPVSDTTENLFEKVDKEAEFPGGSDGWKKYLQQNLNPNVPVDNSAPAGMYTVMVQFVVNLDGSLADIKPLTKLGYGMEQEVVRILRKSGAWIPAIQHDRPVRAYRKQPVIFMIEDDAFSISTKVPYTLFTETDNELTVEAYKIKNGDIELTSAQAIITPAGDGKFRLRINKPGRIIIEVYNTKKKKTIGTASFEVKSVKDK